MKSKISKDEVIALARLTKLKLNDEEIDLYTKEISELLQYFEQLDKLDLTNTKPTISVGEITSVMRPDTVEKQPATPDELRAVLPNEKDQFIRVKRMI